MPRKRQTEAQRREKNRLLMREKRKDPIYRKKEKKTETEYRRRARADEEHRNQEQKRDTRARRRAREDVERRRAEQERDTEAHRIAREDDERRREEQGRDTAAHRIARENVERRREEQKRNTEAHRIAREDVARRRAEQERDTEAHRIAREDDERRREEQERNTEAHRIAREDVERRIAEQEMDTEAHRIAREDEERQRTEQLRNTKERANARKTPKKRIRDRVTNAQSMAKKRLLFSPTFDSLLHTFTEKIKEGPTYICSCCGRLWYKASTVVTTESTILARGHSEDTFEKVVNLVQDTIRLCNTCWKHVKAGKIPKLALSNGFGLPLPPEELKNLSPLEERLVAARIPFMQIRVKGLERQSALRGNVVNVENDLSECAKALPRKFNDTSVVQVMFKRRLNYRGTYWNERIRPAKVYKAAKYLINSEAYRKENILLSDDWSGYEDDAAIDFICEDEPHSHEETELQVEDITEETYDERINLGAEETLIYNESCPIIIAPGEKNVPIPLRRDLRAEELSFPATWCGIERRFNESVKISYTDVKKSDITQWQRNAATPSQCLYAYKKSFNEKIRQAIQIALRRRKLGEKGSITAGTITAPGFVHDTIHVDDGYPIFKTIRSSPPYWKQQTKRVIAMVRQLGKCQLFITFSSAETRWAELLVTLHKIQNKEDISQEEALQLTFEQKAQLIRSDPVTCMQHFDYKYRTFLNELMKKQEGVFDPYSLTDYFSRVEFQVRGSPHSHGLYWLKGVPEYIEGDEESEKKVCAFIDELITCRRDEQGEMENLIGYQLHKHSHTCKKNNTLCRFMYPKPPLPSTRILQPLPKDYDKKDKQSARQLHKKIQFKLDEMGRSFKENIPFHEFLESLGCSEEEYMTAIRSNINRGTVFLRRQTSEIFVNAYNKKMLMAWKANMDIQFVLDTYACAKYCVGYIMKAEGGVSKLLQTAEKDIKRGNFTIQEKLNKYAGILINGSEISAQEAVAFLLGLPNTKSSRTDVFINTSNLEQRVKMLKSNDEISSLDPDSEDVFQKGLLEHYINRPKSTKMENLCLAEFASMYNFSSKKRKPLTDQPSTSAAVFQEDSSSAESYRDDDLEEESYDLLDGSGSVRKRRMRKIIRFRHYSRAGDELNYWREQLMLFVPWRNEAEELGGDVHVINKAQLEMDRIIHNSSPFYSNRDVDDILLQDQIDDVFENEVDDEEESGFQFDQDVEEQENYVQQFLSDARTSEATHAEQFRPPIKIDDTDYYKLMRQLNDKQRRLVLTVLHHFKNADCPFHIFLSGGAGVGKSHAINAIVQSVKRYDAKFPTETPDDVCVLVSAPTGKAAFNVDGMTCHSLFRLQPKQRGEPQLDLKSGALNTVRRKLRNVKLFIIDEVSMLSSRDLLDIDKRLKQIFNSNEDFGGKSMLVVGHLRQLPPVMAPYVFTDLRVQRGSLTGNYLWKEFRFYEFDEIMRQRGEFEFCKALNNMAEGVMDDEDIRLIQSREISTSLQPPDDAIWLFYSNLECEEYNLKIHQQLQTEEAMSTAYDRIEGRGTERRKRSLLESAKTFKAQQTDGIPYQVHLQLGAIYFVSTNVNVSDGLFNGSTGTLRRIDYGVNQENIRIPTAVWLSFPTESVGAMRRSLTRAYQVERNIPLDWTSIERVTRNLSKLGSDTLQVVRTQLPLVAANAITINKSQGSTISNVVLGLGKRKNLKRELLYVACSRATSINGLFIDGKFNPPKKPKDDDKVTLEMERLRKCPLEFPFRFLQDYHHCKERLYFHNIENFSKYKADMCADQCAMSSTIMTFVEPHIQTDNGTNINTYKCVGMCPASAGESGTKSDGGLVYRKEGFSELQHMKMQRYTAGHGHLMWISFTVDDVIVVALYRNKKFPEQKFMDVLDENLKSIDTQKSILVGDININLKTSHGDKVKHLFQLHGFNCKIDVNKHSTDYRSTIDCCFSNMQEVEAWYYETYYSYHKSLCVVW